LSKTRILFVLLLAVVLWAILTMMAHAAHVTVVA
jgi:hypothetical protein